MRIPEITSNGGISAARPVRRPGPEPALSLHGLTKRYGDRPAVDSLDLELPAGSVTGFVGPNGAGKTTTIRMLLGLVARDGGAGTVLGHGIDDREAYLPQVGALIEGPAFYPALTARRNLQVLARAGGLPPERVPAVLGLVGLAERADDQVRSYSLGMKQRLGIAAALLPRPRLMILDEPTNGLDPSGIKEIRTLLRDLAAQGTTVLVSSHLLSEVQTICDRVVLIDRGALVFQGTIHELLASRDSVVIAAPEHQADLPRLLAALQGAGLPVVAEDAVARVTLEPARAAQINLLAFETGILLARLETESASLEDAFFAATAEGGGGR
jgi:ABC-2 type transport system ATP-binding protein